MEWNVYQHEDGSGDWVVEAINFSGDGELATTIFSGCEAESRARQYCDWQGGAHAKAA